jgi:8-oxo-dGTP pyrophosphatase MutT (NUDIX family)
MAKSASRFATSECHQVAALPWRRDANGALLVMLITSRTNGKWMLPKGWPMSGLTDAEAARREALEEAGIEGEVTPVSIGSYRYIKLFNDGTSLPGEAYIYALAVSRERGDWKEKGQRRRQWVAAEQAASMVHEPDLSRFLAALAAGSILLPDETLPQSSVA